jgi:type I restriction enzyme S subunit
VTEGGDIDKLGRGTVWEGQIENCLHQNHIFAIRVNRNIASEYFVSIVMSCDYARKYFIDTAVKTTNLASTNRTKLGNLPILIPSLNEQLRIIEYCKMIDNEYDKVIGVVSNELKQIGELRQILIAEAVAGKIKV